MSVGSIAVEFARQIFSSFADKTVLMIGAGWSYAHALTAPGTDPWTVRSVEWISDHGGRGIVNRVEHWWYTNHPPPVGGKPAHGLPTVAAPGADAVGKKAKTPKSPVVTAPPVPERFLA